MAPGSGLRFVGVQAKVVHLIGNGHPAANPCLREFLLQPLTMAARALVTEQQAMPVVAFREGPKPQLRIPGEQAQAEALGGLVPLVGNRAAVAEHHKAIQPLFLVQLVEAEQGPQGFAGPGSGMDQYISSVSIGGLLAQARP